MAFTGGGSVPENEDENDITKKNFDKMLLIKKYERQKEEAQKITNSSWFQSEGHEINFPEEVIFSFRDKLLIEFTKFIMHMISIFIR